MIGAALGAASPASASPKTSSHLKSTSHSRLAGAVDDIGIAAKGKGNVSLMLQLPGKSAVAAYAAARGKTAAQRKSATESASASSASAQRDVVRALIKAVPKAKVLYKVTTAYNGVAVRVPKADAKKLLKLPGVSAVHALIAKKLDNAVSDQLIGAPAAWEAYGLTGEGVSIGVIDTGIDYDHTDFGGPGINVNNNHTVIGDDPYFGPGAKVVGGYDFAGDAYNADDDIPVIAPDPDPMDCAGHGSHVAGTAAGYGVNSNGSTYSGPYGSTTPFSTMRIGPGVAPKASLFAFRVFGCDGTTNLVGQAIDRAMDPNGDHDLSDHVNVLNLSLGFEFGSTTNDPDVAAADAAAAIGVQVVASAGNSADVTHVLGGVNAADTALSVASSVDSTDVVDGFKVNSPAGIAGVKPASFSAAWDWAHEAAVTGDLYYPTSNPTGCTSGTFSAGDIAGMAGKIVVLDWYASPDAANFACGSVNRTDNSFNNGAAGAIVVDRTVPLSTSITGSTHIPAVFSNKTVGDELKTALAGNTHVVSVTMSNAYKNSSTIVYPEGTDTASNFTSRGPRMGDNVLKPDIAAPGQGIFSVDVGTGTQGTDMSGTSMASPHMAGVMALLRQAHPSWTVEQLKALAMNTADVDIWASPAHDEGKTLMPSRVGTGRVDVPAALTESVVAYDADRHGAVSLSYGAVQPVDAAHFDRTMRVENLGGSPVTYALSYVAGEAVPGVSVSFPNDAEGITVPADDAVDVTVRLTLDPAAMQNTVDPNMALTQTPDGLPRQALSEAQGHVVLTPSEAQPIRVALHATVRPASSMGVPLDSVQFSSAKSTASLPLTGTGLDTGAADPRRMQSIASAYELQGMSGNQDLPDSSSGADIQYVGVSRNSDETGDQALFGISTFGQRSLPDFHEAEFDVFIDTNNDYNPEFVLYNSRLTESNGDPTDVFASALYDFDSGDSTPQGYLNYFDASTPTALYDSHVLAMPLYLSDIGSSSFTYWVDSFDQAGDFTDEVGPMHWNAAAPGLDASGVSNPFYLDAPDNHLDVSYDAAALSSNESLGMLVLHHMNTGAQQAQALEVGVRGDTPPADSTLVITPDEASVSKGLSRPFHVAAHYGDGVVEDVTELASWSSAGSAATVSNTPGSKGVANAVAVGDAVIMASYHGLSASAPMHVTAPVLTGLAIAPDGSSMPKGLEQAFTVTGTYTDGSTADVTDTVTWSSSAPAVATISNTAGSRGKAQGVGAGTSTIGATLGDIVDTTVLTVTNAVLASVSVTPSTPSIPKGTTQQFTAIGTYSDGTSQDLTDDVTWTTTSAHASVVDEVDSPGLFKGVSLGSAAITATMGSTTGTGTLQVVEEQLSSIAVSPVNPSAAKGTDRQFTATGTYTDGSTRDLTNDVDWSSSTASATVSDTGLAHGVSVGSAVIKATWAPFLVSSATIQRANLVVEAISGQTTLTVTPATLLSLSLSPAGSSIAKGLTRQFTAIGHFSDGTSSTVTSGLAWSTSGSAATLTSGGKATAIAVGTSIIKVAKGAVSAATTLTVTPAKLLSITISTPTHSATLPKGTSRHYYATGHYTDGNRDVTNVATWTSSAPSILRMSPDHRGVATGVSLGSARITAKAGGFTAGYDVKVIKTV